MKRKKILVILFAILLVGFLIRLYRFDNPIADWHSWRQADTAAVSRNFVKYGFDLLHPRMNNISNVQSGFENPQGYFFAEFPIYNATQAGLFLTFHIFTIEEWGRLLTIFSSLVATVFIYLLTKRHSNTKIALFAAGFYALLPYNIYYGRVILPEPSMTMAILGGTYFFDRWIERSSKFKVQNSKLQFKSSNYLEFIFAIFFTALAFLIKPVAAFFTLPIIYLAWKRFGFKSLLRIDLWLLLVLSIAPLLWWRWWESHYPEGIPAFLWLFNGNNIRFHPAFFRWIFYERITKLISGYIGIIFILSGVLHLWRSKKEALFFFSFAASSLLYLFTLATGNVQHDYYQIAIMPTVAIFMAFGVVWLVSFLDTYFSAKISYSIAAILILVSFWFSWSQVKDYFNINNPSIIAAGKAIDTLTPKDAKIVANYNGDSSFLYQMNRQGWASFEKPMPEMIKLGASYLVLVNPTAQDMVFAKQYKVIAKTSQYVIFDLVHK